MDRRRYLALCAAVGSTAGCSLKTPTETQNGSGSTETPGPPLDGSWTQYQHDSGNTGSSADAGPATEPTARWSRAPTTGAPATAPAAADGIVVVVTEQGLAYARDADSGAVRWRAAVEADPTVAPVASGGVAVVAGADGLYGLALDTGDRRWHQPLDGIVALTTDGKRVVAATADGVRALTLADGSAVWTRETTAEPTTPPAVGDGRVAAVLGETLAVFAAATGNREWTATLESAPAFAPALAHGRVYVAAGGRLVARTGESGAHEWTQGMADPVAAAPVTTADGVAVSTIDTDVARDRHTPDSDEETPTPAPEDVEWLRATVAAYDPAGDDRWQASIESRYNFTSGPPDRLPLVADGDLLVLGVSGSLHALASDTGATRWTGNAGGVPALTDGVVTTGIRGLDRGDGAVRWAFPASHRVSGPAVVENTAYLGSRDTHLYALAANDGSVRWAARTDGPIDAVPAVDEETVYAGTDEGTLYAFDRTDGTERWRRAVGGNIRAPSLHDDTLYVGTFSRTLTAVDTADGTVRWRATVEDDDETAFVALETATDGDVVVTGANGDLRAFDTADGTERWRVTAKRRMVQSPPVVADGTVLVHMGAGLRALDASDGSERWRRELGQANQPPVVRDGTVYASGERGIAAFALADGEEQWRTNAGDDLRLAAGDGTLFGYGYDSPVVAFDTDDGSVRWHGDGTGVTSPAVVGEYLFVGDETGRLRALAPTDED